MGYRIGYQCFASQEDAADWLLSQQPPTITAEGKVIRPYKVGQTWQVEGRPVNLYFPQCDIAEQIKLGIFTTFPLLFLFFMVWGFRILYKLVYSATNPAEGGGGDD